MSDSANRAPGEGRTLTNRQGHPVSDNQNERTIGPRAPGHVMTHCVPNERVAVADERDLAEV